jgi:N-acetylglucosamine-6-phosphate deacetylase
VVVIEDGSIASITSREAAPLPVGTHLNYPGATVVPAFFDVHIHGCAGRDVMESTPRAFEDIGRFLAGRGVGAYLATTVSAPADTTLRSLSGMARWMGQAGGGAQAVGIHIEGPFLSHAKRGAHAAADLLPPTVEFFDRMWQAAEGRIRLMTIAPELPGALEVIARAVGLGVRVSLGHTNATEAEARAGIQAGATSATHTFNAMRRFDHRDPGVLGAVLTDDALFAEIVCDGLHVEPSVVAMWLRAKGPGRAMLVTDAMSGTGMPDGSYKLGELDVELVDGRCVIGETLAGSTLTMDRAVRNVMAYTGCSLSTAAALAGANPARMAGLDAQMGELAAGRRADLVVLTENGDVQATLLGGRLLS